MKGRIMLGRRASAGVLVLVLGAVLAATAAQAQTSALKVVYRGVAWGTYVKVGNVFKQQPTFAAQLSPCSARAGSVSRRTGASAHVAGTLQTGTISNRVSSGATAKSGTTRATSIIHSTNLLNGLVRATVVTASGRVTYTVGSGFHFGHSTSFVGLSVAGHSVTVHANTRVTLPGVGYVILDQQKHSVHNGMATQVVNAIHVVVTASANVLGLHTGTNIVVGHVAAAVKKPTRGGPVSGYAFGSHARVGNTAQSGYSARVTLPCFGGTSHTAVATAAIPKIASSATIHSIASSRITATSTSAKTSSTIQSAKLAGGLISARGIVASIRGRNNGASHRFTDGSSLASLTVNGKRITVKTNLVLRISKLGTLWVHHVIRTRRGMTVRMLDLHLSAGNRLGLKTGTVVHVGVAHIAFRD